MYIKSRQKELQGEEGSFGSGVKLAAEEWKNLTPDSKKAHNKKYDEAMAAWQEHSSVGKNAADVKFKVRTTNGEKLETQLPRNLGRCYVNKKKAGGVDEANKLLKELFKLGMDGATRSDIEQCKRARYAASPATVQPHTDRKEGL
jgi:hypothetical protein